MYKVLGRGDGNFGVILEQVCEPFFNLSHLYTWSSKKGTFSYTWLNKIHIHITILVSDLNIWAKIWVFRNKDVRKRDNSYINDLKHAAGIIGRWSWYFHETCRESSWSPPVIYFYWPFQGGTSFVDHLCYSCLVFFHAFASGYCCLVVSWREKADLLALVCDVYCDFVTFPFGILRQVWYLTVSIPDPSCLSYFAHNVYYIEINIWATTWDFQQCGKCDQQSGSDQPAHMCSLIRTFASRLKVYEC